MIGLPVPPGILLAGSLATGLSLSPFFKPPLPPLAIAMLALPLLFLRRPFSTTGLGLLLLGFCLGLGSGELRLKAIDGGAYEARPGQVVTYHGHLSEPPRQDRDGHRLYLSGPDGRVVAFADQLPDWVVVGTGIELKGRVEEAPAWLRNDLLRRGIKVTVRAEQLRRAPPRKGLTGALDRIRQRALSGLQAGMQQREAELAGGFVLGQDDGIDAQTKENFRRSGLAHLLAVSGQNVMLLILLGSLPLIVAGVHLRHRMWPLALLVLIYLPLTGAGPSIQRATVMGIVMLLMLRLGQPSQRYFALLAAVAGTLLVNPRITGDIGWQLSFVATVAIMVLATGLRQLLLDTPSIGRLGGIGRLLADGAAVTLAASVATAPLMAHHFESLPLGTVSANLLALPAVAPVMWLGMLAAIAGQLPGAPTEAINLINSVLIAYIAEVARLIASLESGVLAVSLEPGWLVALSELAVVGLGWLATSHLLRRRRRSSEDGRSLAARLTIALALIAVAVPAAAALIPDSLFGEGHGSPAGLRIVAIDVGQGDAILVQDHDLSLLIDTGPPNAGIARSLASYGVDRLEAVFITHSHRDHIGGLDEVISNFPTKRLFLGDEAAGRRGSHPISTVIRQGERMRFGGLVIDTLWPPPAGNALNDGGDLNSHSLVLLLRWRGFKALFSGDAEAETAPFPAPDIDLLKVAHHGSADTGLPALLQATTPAMALISVGADNGYGHPAPATLAELQAKSIPAHRTDREGDLVLELAGSRD